MSSLLQSHKRTLRIFALTILGTLQIFSQSTKLNLRDDAEKARADFAIPDAPAFKVLDTIPEAILRPSTAREVGIVISNLLTSTSTLPKGFALEVTPYLLFAGRSLSGYLSNPFLYRLKISAGLLDNQDGSKDFGWGVRLTIVNKSDLRTDRTLLDSILHVGHEFDHLGDIADGILNDFDLFGTNPAEYNRRKQPIVDSLKDEQRKAMLLEPDTSQTAAEYFDQRVVGLRERAKERNWNKELVEMALAGKSTSSDSLAKNLMATTYTVWGVVALPLDSQTTQLVGGINGSFEKNQDQVIVGSDFSLGSRFYAGNNSYKGFAEIDWQLVRDQQPFYTLKLGGELNIMNGIWVDCTIGYQKRSGDEAQLTSGVNLRFSTPEVK